MGIVSDSVMAYGRAQKTIYMQIFHTCHEWLSALNASNRKTMQRLNDITWDERKMCYFTSADAIHVMKCHINFIGILFDAQLGIMKIIYLSLFAIEISLLLHGFCFSSFAFCQHSFSSRLKRQLTNQFV